jgi:hypothetical protein
MPSGTLMRGRRRFDQRRDLGAVSAMGAFVRANCPSPHRSTRCSSVDLGPARVCCTTVVSSIRGGRLQLGGPGQRSATPPSEAAQYTVSNVLDGWVPSFSQWCPSGIRGSAVPASSGSPPGWYGSSTLAEAPGLLLGEVLWPEQWRHSVLVTTKFAFPSLTARSPGRRPVGAEKAAAIRYSGEESSAPSVAGADANVTRLVQDHVFSP